MNSSRKRPVEIERKPIENPIRILPANITHMFSTISNDIATVAMTVVRYSTDLRPLRRSLLPKNEPIAAPGKVAEPKMLS